MDTEDYAELLQAHSIRPTSNRILILRALGEMPHPVSMRELEDVMDTVDKSSLSRTLALMRGTGLVHTIEGSEGVMLFELCRSRDGHRNDNDEHVHFFCTVCHRTLCLTDTPSPQVSLPEGFEAEAVNCLVKGVCRDCAARRNTSRERQPS